MFDRYTFLVYLLSEKGNLLEVLFEALVADVNDEYHDWSRDKAKKVFIEKFPRFEKYTILKIETSSIIFK